MEPPKPIIVKKTINRPVIMKPQNTSARPSVSSSSSSVSYTPSGSIISKRTYTKNISNRFARGYCTRYAAIILPNIFPYTSETTQSREFGGDAKNRCENAKAAGFRIGNQPAAGAAIVYH
jgi:surface antigen